MFTIKTFDTITASIINNLIALSDEITDFNIGSKVRTLIEANAREIDQLYQAILKGLYESIPVAIYKAFDFQKLSATGSSGYVTVTRSAGSTGDILIPQATRFQATNSNLTFTSVSDVTMASESNTVNVFIMSTGTGTDYNTGALTITTMLDTISGIASCTNTDAFTDATDAETEMERKLRFQLWLSTIPRATKTAVEYGATLATVKNSDGVVTEHVDKVVVWEPTPDDTPAGRGTIKIWVWNGVEGASESLLAEVLKTVNGYTEDSVRIPGWKAAGVIAYVGAVIPRTVNVAMTVTVETGRDWTSIQQELSNAISLYFQELEIGENFVVANLIDAAMNISGVYDVSVSSPSSNFTPGTYEICTQGTVALTKVDTPW